MKAKEARDLGTEELKKTISEFSEKIQKIRFDISLKQAKNSRELRNIKRGIARLETILKERLKK